MSRRFLAERSRQAEMMDAPDLNPADLDHAMRHLEVVNRWLNGYGPSLAGIEKLLPESAKQFSLLDVGCGSGDTLRQIAQWARRRNLEAQLVGIELSARSAQRAAASCRDFPEITIRHQDIFELPPHEKFGIIHCALVLHHFSQDKDVVQVLRCMYEAAHLGVIVNDLHRHPAAYHSIRVLTRLLSRSRILQNDAPLSVARAFTKHELESFAAAADLQNVTIEWQWAFRWLMISSVDSEPAKK